ncbi:S8 family peptidase [Saccharothrix mutabilis subsp. mutabilis]|uniref:S8 family peptidase n=1 Tax=Saccharothrix mutabilis subsp. mutabilis TaxID=66855 RepID=A0ABN0UPW3_9PSEU
MRTLLPGLAAAVLTAAVVATPAAAEGTVLHAGSPTAVPGSYIVKLKPGATAPAVTADRTFAGGFTARLGAREARRLAAHPAVAYVEQDQHVRANATQFNAPWGLDRIDQRSLPLDTTYSYTSTGATTSVYVVDTGIRTTHEEFGGRAFHGYDAVDRDNVAQDDNGHGTHVAGIIAGKTYGAGKAVDVYGVRVLNGSGSGTISGVIAGVDWVAANARKPAVANFSLGGGASTALDDAVRRLIASGVTVVVSAGSSGSGTVNTSPARVAEAVTVGATTQTDARASSSNYGPGVDLFAPGVNIRSAWNSGDTAVNTLSGTSMATAFASGVAARYLQFTPTASPAQVHAELVREATPLPWGGKLLYWNPAR